MRKCYLKHKQQTWHHHHHIIIYNCPLLLWRFQREPWWDELTRHHATSLIRFNCHIKWHRKNSDNLGGRSGELLVSVFWFIWHQQQFCQIARARELFLHAAVAPWYHLSLWCCVIVSSPNCQVNYQIFTLPDIKSSWTGDLIWCGICTLMLNSLADNKMHRNFLRNSELLC